MRMYRPMFNQYFDINYSERTLVKFLHSNIKQKPTNGEDDDEKKIVIHFFYWKYEWAQLFW